MTAIAICDDEQYMLSVLTEKITAYMDKTKIDYKIWRFDRAEALLASPQPFDLVFLDIQMGQVNGMEAAKKLREKGNGCFLVFVSVLKEYARRRLKWKRRIICLNLLMMLNYTRRLTVFFSGWRWMKSNT